MTARWRSRLAITQQCRPEALDAVEDAYRRIGIHAELAAFFDDVPQRLASAHLMISRAGASTVAEITTVGCPAMLVPYPFAADDHQAANAKALADLGGAWVIPQDELPPSTSRPGSRNCSRIRKCWWRRPLRHARPALIARRRA